MISLALRAIAAGAVVFGLCDSALAASCSFAAATSTETCIGYIIPNTGINFTYSSPNFIENLTVESLSDDITPLSGGYGISLTGSGAKGSNGSDGTAIYSPDNGGNGQDGPNLTIDYVQPGADLSLVNSGAVIGTNAAAIYSTSIGGNGGSGGNAYGAGDAANGGNGGNGGNVSIDFQGAASTTGNEAAAVVAVSVGGNGGNGGDVDISLGGTPGRGGKGGHSGIVTVSANGTITTSGSNSDGIHAVSRGGAGGSSGSCGALFCGSGSGGNAAYGGNVNVSTTESTAIQTYGTFSNGIYAASIGGFAGSGGTSIGLVAFGSSGASAGDGGTVVVDNKGTITTDASNSYGIFAQSIGGGGGGGGSAGALLSLGGSGSSGGSGGDVTVTNTSLITTWGSSSIGLLAQSIGGSGGDGGNSAGLVAIGGNGSATSPGGTVTVTNTGTITTHDKKSEAILAQSIGGGGGNGGTSGGIALLTVGGSGGGGGNGNTVEVNNNGGTLSTGGNDSAALRAQSIGGGGGNGGDAYSGGAGFALAIGGIGGKGGNGDVVSINPTTDVNSLKFANITTTGDRSYGIQAQSIGGGGGNGGLAVTVSNNEAGSISLAIGGAGNNGGTGDQVIVNEKGTITTSGDQSDGIMAQSIGGGGGNGGGSVSVSTSESGGAFAFAIGGSGGKGQNANSVTVNAVGDITTRGNLADGIFAQSIGGGGGNGGFAVTAAGGLGSGSLALGGAGKGGGDGGTVTVDVSGTGVHNTIQTSGIGSVGILAQSVGGGGGNGGFAGAFGVGGVSINVGLGGSGGVGGVGDTVKVTNSDGVITGGDKAAGILAQSVGGGGGNGGFALSGSAGVISVAAAVGGSGGAGSNGGTVTVDNSGTITTSGKLSYGILAQSIGGGGGNGGFALSGAFSLSVPDLPAGAAAISVGGNGGGASDSGTVTVDNSSSIETFGLGAHAILAQSVGGGGGSGGFAGSVSISNSGLASTGSFGVAVGGSGGGGGNGHQVNVTSDAATTITTHNDGADGILAQSIGGGGGDGGFAFSGAFGFGVETNVNVAVAIGGFGSDGGTGDIVQVDNQAAITTSGAYSNGIVAQSIGGGGGNGGLAVSGTLGISATPGNVGVTVGGFAGDGGTAGNVTITNAGAIMTSGIDSFGILGQSIGGSGGNGGMALTVQLTGASKTDAALGVAIGGGGGTGNSAGTVTITNKADGTINTSGFGAHGIEAQSIGGGGGNGGMALVAQLGVVSAGSEAEADATKTLTVGIAVGGAGGGGGFGKEVQVTNNGVINVTGDTATGIFAQSIGGGGGDGGGAVDALGMLTDSTNKSSRSVNVNVSVGGAGGNGNNGGLVTVDNTGSITTHGVGGNGIYAESVGGGGGIGGNANTIALVVTDQCTVAVLCEAPESNANNIKLGVTVGGNGGGASDGGTVTVNNSGEINTFRGGSDGIYAQSIGGGGGNGGNGVLGLGGLLPFGGLGDLAAKVVGSAKFYQSLSIAVGGDEGSSGNGGEVKVENHQNITTHAQNSNGIFAQSVGGGGGIGGDAVTGLTGTLGIGGKGGAAGNGGNVTVTQDSGATIETFGFASNGIFAQSIGGGGGVAGNVDRFLAADIVTPIPGVTIPKLNVGAGFAIGQNAGGGGDGGSVSVSVDGTILTHGDVAAGIVAESVGGGGGILGDLGNDSKLYLGSWQAGSNGDLGNAGAVDVTLTGMIATSGDIAAGIFAQSAAGTGQGKTGKAGDVTVTLNGSIETGAILGREDGTASHPLRGLGSIGIFAQSVAVDNTKNGNIAINLNDSNGIVQGGRTNILHIGVGIWIEDGNNNTITNHGLVTTLGGVKDGYAILATGSDANHPGGNETVSNFGTVTGSFDLGAGTNSFINEAAALLNSGHMASVGIGNVLTNDGAISPGALNHVFTTSITGNLVQSGTADYLLDLDLGSQTADRINVSGTAGVTGTIPINILNPGLATPGDHTVTILSAAGTVTDHTGLALDYIPSVMATYSLAYPNANDIVLNYDINFSPPSLLTLNQASVGNAINQIQAEHLPGFLPIAAALFYVPDTNSLRRAYDSLSGEGTGGTEQTAFTAGSMFSQLLLYQGISQLNRFDDSTVDQALQYAPEPSGLEAFAWMKKPSYQSSPWRAWFAGFGGDQRLDGEASTGSAELTQRTGGGAIGLDYHPNPNTLIGFAAGGSASNFSVSDRATTGSVLGAHVGAYAVGRWAGNYVAGALSYGRYTNKTNRYIVGVGPTELATGSFASDQLTARLEVGSKHHFNSFSVTPFVATEFSNLWQRGYTESSHVVGGGPGLLGLSFASHSIESFSSFLGAEFDQRFVSYDGTVWAPYVRASWVHEFYPDRTVLPSFIAAPSIRFAIYGARAASNAARIDAGAKVLINHHTSIFADVDGNFSNRSARYAALGGLKVGW